MPNSQDTPDPVELIRRTLRRLIVATVVLYLLTMGAAVYVYLESQVNRNALCTFRANLEDQVAQSTNFLADHPAGVPGITPAVIQQGIQKQVIAINSLSSLSC